MLVDCHVKISHQPAVVHTVNTLWLWIPSSVLKISPSTSQSQSHLKSNAVKYLTITMKSPKCPNMHLKPRSYWCTQSESAEFIFYPMCVGPHKNCYLLLQVWLWYESLNRMNMGDYIRARSGSYIRLKCNTNANCHTDASGLWLPTGPCDAAECISGLIASLRGLCCPGRSWGCH